MSPHFKALLFAVATVLICTAGHAQTPTPSPSATPVASPTPLPLAELTAQIVSAEDARGKIEGELASEPPLAANGDTTVLLRKIEASLADTARMLASEPSLETIRDLEARWQTLSEALDASIRSLTERVTHYDEQLANLDDLTKIATLVRKDDGTPKELLTRLDALGVAIKKNRDTIQKRRGGLAVALSQAQTQEHKLGDMVALVKQARTQAAGRLFVTESMPLWSLPIWSEPLRLSSGFNLAQETRTAWSKQWADFAQYARAQANTFLLHGFLFIALLAGLYWARRRARDWADDEPSLKRAALVFEMPISMTIAFSLVAASWIYPKAPPLLIAIGGAAALVPAILILRRLLDRHLFPILNALVVFYAIDQFLTVADALPILARLLFLAEMGGGALFLVWLLRAGQLDALREQDERLAKVTFPCLRLTLAVFLASFLANLLGCVSLGNLLGHTTLQSAYLAVVLYAVTRIVDGLILAGFSAKPLADLGMIRHHRTLIWRRTHRSFQLAAFLFWAFESLDLLSLRSPLIEKAQAFLFVVNKSGVSDFTLLGQFLAFGAVVWASFLISRFLRFALEEDFYPRISVQRGLSYAVSTMLHYTVLLLGFYLAASVAGIDMTKFNILVGAFGVGMGFGLQNIINNFVSGVILLFERPVKVGDVVQMDAATSGVVDRIGIRASIIRTSTGAEIIVPNGKLISEQVINWTLSSRLRAVEIPVSTPATADPCHVIEILTRLANAHPLIAAKPASSAQLMELGADTLQFKLSAWTEHAEKCGGIRSDLAVAIHTALVKEGIRSTTLPVPAVL